MTPAARVAAAVDILDAVLAGAPAERQLTTWARQNRYAGSKDRAAVRDLVFQALRCRRSYAALGGGETGRALILGGMRARDEDPAQIFTGEGYAPSPLTGAELAPATPFDDLPEAVALDCSDWLIDELKSSLGNDFGPVMKALRERAPVFVRVNARKATRAQVIDSLTADDVGVRPHPLSETALEVVSNPRRVNGSQAYRDGWIELQDAASQAITDSLPLRPGMKVLDYCAGGGGKTLAMAGRQDARYFAHDAAPQRMRDLPERAKRAGVAVQVLASPDVAGQAPYDLVLCDVPCSGSGAWRRSPEGKWRLTEDDLAHLVQVQADILDRAAGLVAKGGTLAYATCSLLDRENGAQVSGFLTRHSEFALTSSRRLTPLDGGDGFFVAILEKR